MELHALVTYWPVLKTVIPVAAGIILLFLVFALIVQWVWNTISTIFHKIPKISYKQSIAVLLAAMFLKEYIFGNRFKK